MIDGETGLSNNCLESPSVQLGMVWNDHLGERFFAADNQMAPVSAPNMESSGGKSFDTFSS